MRIKKCYETITEALDIMNELFILNEEGLLRPDVDDMTTLSKAHAVLRKLKDKHEMLEGIIYL